MEAHSGGVEVTLIDFTLSRLTLPSGVVAFCDLGADPALFLGPKNDCQVRRHTPHAQPPDAAMDRQPSLPALSASLPQCPEPRVVGCGLLEASESAHVGGGCTAPSPAAHAA